MIPSTKEKILAATMDLIKAEGLDGVTIRKIAGLAGTNVALVNYYFGSKEKLISETLKLQLYSFRAAFHAFDELELPPLERIKKFLLLYTASLQEHPELIKKVLFQDQIFESQTEYALFLKNQGFDKLGSALTEITGITSRDSILLILQQMFGAILTPIIKSSFNHKNEVMDKEIYHTNSSVEEQIDLFLDHYFYKYTTR
ncbi:TetR/AcrR family transcriptional regulator [Paenibacillus glycanilyticus]|uniref:TetR/AcrR family transcriptional regulator n=1 Tax=Paenibacillus glycanilyticus TaxID=126569 RepID=UPI00204226E6|nr:TetR/AcrR family transcriptional regulator [Paenibacillus glycanilyticus]MCM3626536.1 TetR/AcrR family transcriptional regulator [Paenibacillus glycanilyticus]